MITEEYDRSLRYLYGLQKYGIKFGLSATTNLLDRLGNPHEGLNYIHIAGSNGKGSVGAMISSILTRAGYRVGYFTSPHLIDFTERFRINDNDVSRQRIVEIFNEVREKVLDEQPPTFFEIVTAMGLLYFAQEKVEWAIMEVGMGGRLDATNVINPQLCLITSLSLEHKEYLGSTLTAIAREKAGIIKRGVPVITGVRQPSALAVIKAKCCNKGSPLWKYKRDFQVRRHKRGLFDYQGHEWQFKGLEVKLLGDHQIFNATLALAGLEVANHKHNVLVSLDDVERGLLHVKWPGRLEVLEQDPILVLDGAHNPAGAEALHLSLQKEFRYKKLHLILGIMHDKDCMGILKRLVPFANSVIFTRPHFDRSADPERLRTLARPLHKRLYVIPDVLDAINQTRNIASKDDLICIAGSLYLVGEVKELYKTGHLKR